MSSVMGCSCVHHCLRRSEAALTNNGVRGPFQALGPTILRNAPANSIYLGSFEVLKKEFAKYKGCE